MSRRRVLIGLVIVGVLLASVATLIAQDRGRGRRGDRSERDGPPSGDRFGRGGTSSGTPEERIKRRMERAERMFGWFDGNQDGVIEPNEVHGQGRYIYERMAKEAGLDPTHSVSVNELRTAVTKQIEKDERGGGAQPPAAQPPGGAQPGQPPSAAPQPKVAGFGAPPREAPKVGGFGAPGAASPGTPGGASSSGAAQGSAGGSPASSPGEKKELDDRIRNYADSLLKRYDENKNGVLERDEWKNMRGSPEKSDKNNDGVITLDELTARLAEFSSRDGSGSESSHSHSQSSTSSSGSAGSSSTRTSFSSPKTGDKKSYRFLTSLERLPKGLPDWFARKDADGDGQVSMAEYSSDWDDSKAGEFAKYDLNGDGIITPAECLAAEKAK